MKEQNFCLPVKWHFEASQITGLGILLGLGHIIGNAKVVALLFARGASATRNINAAFADEVIVTLIAHHIPPELTKELLNIDGNYSAIALTYP